MYQMVNYVPREICPSSCCVVLLVDIRIRINHIACLFLAPSEKRYTNLPLMPLASLLNLAWQQLQQRFMNLYRWWWLLEMSYRSERIIINQRPDPTLHECKLYDKNLPYLLLCLLVETISEYVVWLRKNKRETDSNFVLWYVKIFGIVCGAACMTLFSNFNLQKDH